MPKRTTSGSMAGGRYPFWLSFVGLWDNDAQLDDWIHRKTTRPPS